MTKLRLWGRANREANLRLGVWYPDDMGRSTPGAFVTVKGGYYPLYPEVLWQPSLYVTDERTQGKPGTGESFLKLIGK